MNADQILSEIREANLSYLMLAQSLIRSDREQALYRLGISEESASLIALLSPAQMMKIAAGNTLLILAAHHGHAAAVQALVDRGATVDAVNDRGETPLAGAVSKGYADVVQVLVAAGAYGRAAIDAVHLDIGDVDGLAAEASDAAASGFTATACIHPSQVPVVREAYRPDAERLEWARAVLAAAASEPGVFAFRGEMVDAPVLRQAEALVRRAGRA